MKYERFSKILTLLSLLAVGICFGLLFVSGFGTKAQWWDYPLGLTLLRFGAYTAVAGALFALFGLLFSMGQRSWKRVAFNAIALALLGAVVAKGLIELQRVQSLPMIHDITTDTENPPKFVAIIELRKDAPNSIHYPGHPVATQQKQAYPDIQTRRIDLPADQVFSSALKVAEALGWKVVGTEAPTHIEATDTTRWFGFKDDIVIRIRPTLAGTLVDMRSVSRVGLSDVGTNAQRIRRFFQELNRQTDL